MESLAFMVVLIVCAVYLCGPLAVLFAVNQRTLLAVLTGACACWLGIYFFVTVFTWMRYFGLISAALGLYAMYHVAQSFMDS